MRLRRLRVAELADAAALCMRSKAVWGYDEAFMAACRDELTLSPEELEESFVIVAEEDGALRGVGQLVLNDGTCELEKLFVEPAAIGRGVGKMIFDALRDEAVRDGAERMLVTADPDAVPFYQRMGFRECGHEPSGSIPGRTLPVLALDLAAQPVVG
ncbi:MAG: GNAT family N-acetyltransferase [Pseudomonadota bacterium]